MLADAPMSTTWDNRLQVGYMYLLGWMKIFQKLHGQREFQVK